MRTAMHIDLCRGTTPLHFAAGAHKNAEDICNLLLDRCSGEGGEGLGNRVQ